MRKKKLSAFKRGDVYLATKKIGKNNPKADKITLNNKVIQDWNRTVDHALVSGMERKEILKVKQEQISTPIKESIHKYGNHPELLFMIIFRAIELLKELIKLLIQKQEQQKARISDLMERRNEKQEKQPAPSVTQTDNQTNSIHRKLAEKQAEVQKREQDRDFNYRSPSDRGAR